MKRLASLLTLVFTFVCVSAFAAEPEKIGVVDLQKIMRTSSQVKDLHQKLEKEFKPRRDKLVEMDASLKADMEKFKRDSAVMSDTQKKDLEKKIIAAQQQLESDTQAYQRELTTANNEAMEKLYEKVTTAVALVAKKEGYKLIVQKDAASFSVDILDVTDKVVKEIN